MSYVSIDIETLGLNNEYCDVIEFGAVIDNLSDPVDKLPRFHCYLTPPKDRTYYRGEPYAMAMHHVILSRIAAEQEPFKYYEPHDLGFYFAHWLEDNGYKRGCDDDPIKIVVGGKNFASFDWNFLRKIDNFERWIKIHHRIMDPCMMYFDAKKDSLPPGLDECLKRAGISKSVQHTAVEDAIDVIRCLRYKWNLEA